MRTPLCFLTALLCLLVDSVRADERLKDIACRSVHLGYPAPAGQAFYNEVTVENTAPGTYFCVCGFSKGYFGIQELSSGKKGGDFSVWDPGSQDDPSKVDETKRVKLLHQGEGVRIGRFGNEGTGGQSFFDIDWKVGETYRFLVTARPDGDRTEFAGYFYLNDEKKWKHLVTFSTITGGKPLSGYYSFVEDFRRNGESAKLTRQARFGNGWVFTDAAKWQPLLNARFTGDSNPAVNINAGPVDDRFFLATGGAITNTGTPLNKTMDSKREAPQPPTDLPVAFKAPEKSP